MRGDRTTYYKTDKEAKTKNMCPKKRLELHQEKSKTAIDELEEWFGKAFEKKIVEPNSQLGKSVKYMNKHWHGLTEFMRTPGVPLGRVEKWRGDVQVFVNFRKRKVPLLDPFPLSSHQTGRADFPHPAFNQSDTTSRFASQLDSQASYIGQVLHKDTCLDIGGTQYLAACAS